MTWLLQITHWCHLTVGVAKGKILISLPEQKSSYEKCLENSPSNPKPTSGTIFTKFNKIKSLYTLNFSNYHNFKRNLRKLFLTLGIHAEAINWSSYVRRYFLLLCKLPKRFSIKIFRRDTVNHNQKFSHPGTSDIFHLVSVL